MTEPVDLPKKKQLHVSDSLADLAGGLIDDPAVVHLEQKRGLEIRANRLVVMGIIISALLMLAGLSISLFSGQPVPNHVPAIGDALALAAAQQPEGLLAMGILILIATPMVRVLGVIVNFVYQRDWRFALVSLLVFLIVLTSALLGGE